MSHHSDLPDDSARRYEAVVRISQAIAACGRPEELAKTLADLLEEFIPFEYLDVLVVAEGTTAVEWHAWGKGSFPFSPELPGRLGGWTVLESQTPVHVADWETDERFPEVRKLFAHHGVRIGAAIRVPLTTPHRRLGTMGVAGAPGVTYSVADVEFLRLIGHVVSFAIDDGLNLMRARAAQSRIELLLDLANRITSTLDFRDVLRAVSGSIRTVLKCDTAGVTIAGPGPGEFKMFALDSAEPFRLQEGVVLVPTGAGRRAYETLTPHVVNEPSPEELDPILHEYAITAGLRSFCFIPLVSRGRALGFLGVARAAASSFGPEDVSFLGDAARQIAIAVENALAYEEIATLKDRLAQEKLYLEDEIRSGLNFGQIIGRSDALKHVLELVETVAPSDSTALLLGETGTGKELIARAIHDHSRRANRTFVKLNCAAIPTGLLESELFGHEKGAFTGAIAQKIGRMELADGGTLFLDEVGDIPIEVQPKLLRALQEREFERLGSTQTRRVDVRLIAATNRDLLQMIKDREFRSDLYYRLHVFPIRVPPLRERREDIPILVSYFVDKFARKMQKRIDSIPASVMRGLTVWDWPGNIRELENFIERAVILTRGKSLEAPLAELRDETTPPRPSQPEPVVCESSEPANPRDAVTGAYEERMRKGIVDALIACRGRVGGADGAAARLGINRSTLLSRMRKLGIYPKQFA